MTTRTYKSDVVVIGGIRTDLGKRCHLHEIDQHAFMKPLTKASFLIGRHADVVPTFYEAYRIATSGEPGPVFVELPVNLQLFPEEVGELPACVPPAAKALPAQADIERAADLLRAAKRPGLFVGWGAADALRKQMPDDAIATVDDGNHTFLTATKEGLDIAYFVFHDGELSQIAQAQEIPYNRKPCAVLGSVNLEGVALATGAAYLRMGNDTAIADSIAEARRISASGRPVVVDVIIDYSKRTAFTKGAVKTNFKRFPLAQRLRMVSRALLRKVTG